MNINTVPLSGGDRPHDELNFSSDISYEELVDIDENLVLSAQLPARATPIPAYDKLCQPEDKQVTG